LSAPDVSKSPDRIERMFDAIAGRYDLLNHLLSAGIDRRWRRRAIQALALTGREVVVDLCTGTGDLAIAAVHATPGAARVVGIDFSSAMLRVGRTKLQRAQLDSRVALIRGDATRIPVGDGSVDAVTIAFGIRNVNNVQAACREMARVLRPGGRLAVLEFAVPETPFLGLAYLWYLHRVLPRIGRAISGSGEAYGYLSASINAFTSPAELVKILRQAGFEDISTVRLTIGSVCLYAGVRGQVAGVSLPSERFLLTPKP
jgi:demethylmenaquinone methyltransferase/2-methoxy-6-polyprenyl-1,4-benzoquinol methylase